MIIQSQDTPKTPILDAQHIPYYPSPDTPLQTESPPAYYGSHGPYVVQGPLQPYIVNDPPLPAYKHEQSPTSRRFLRTLFVAVFILILLGVFLRALIQWSVGWGRDTTHWEYDIPSEFVVSSCVQGNRWNSYNFRTTEIDLPNSSFANRPTDFPYNSLASFSLPVDSDSLFLLGRGQLFSGTLDVTTSPKQPRDSVTIQIRVHYTQESTRNLVKLCKLSYSVADKRSGVGLFTPQWRNGMPYHDWKEDQVVFETTVILSEVLDAEMPLQIKEFRADATSTTYRFADLKKVYFDSVILKGLNAPIEVTSLSARTVNFEAKNGAIKGMFNVTSSLVLSTTDSGIEVDVGLECRDRAKPAFIAHTSNSPINAEISLTSSRHAPDASYAVSATTSNSDLHLHFAAQPVDSRLNISASTTNGPADISMHPAYEGRFVLQSSTEAHIREKRDVRDPSGHGRERHVHYRELQSSGLKVVEGRVQWWGNKGSRRHHDAIGRTDSVVSVRNTNAPLTFAL